VLPVGFVLEKGFKKENADKVVSLIFKPPDKERTFIA
jgi:hypothetical protein